MADVQSREPGAGGSRRRAPSRSSSRSLPRYDAAMRERFEARARRGKVLRYVGRHHRRRARPRSGCSELDAQARLRQHRAHRQRGALRHAPLLQQPAHRAGPGRRAGSHRGRRVRRPAAPRRPTWEHGCERVHGRGAPHSRRPRSATSPSASTSWDLRSMRSGDRVTVTRSAVSRASRSRAIRGVAGDLPLEPAENTAGRALARAAGGAAAGLRLRDARSTRAFRWARASGGSAASAVGAVVAANALLAQPCDRARAAEVRDAGRGGGERLAARRQHLAFAVRRAGADGGHRPSARQADSGAGRRARGDGASAHVPVDQAGARASSSARSSMSDFVWQTANLAGFISGCYTNDLDMIRASLRGRGHRAAAPGADSGLSARCAARRWRPARSAARSPAPGPRCSPGRVEDARAGGARRDAARVRAALASRATTGSSTVQSSGARVVLTRTRSRHVRRMRFASTRGAAPALAFSAALLQGLAPDGGLYVPQRLAAACARRLRRRARAAAGCGAQLHRAVRRGRSRWQPQLRQIITRGLQFSRAARAADAPTGG